MACLLLFI